MATAVEVEVAIGVRVGVAVAVDAGTEVLVGVAVAPPDTGVEVALGSEAGEVGLELLLGQPVKTNEPAANKDRAMKRNSFLMKDLP